MMNDTAAVSPTTVEPKTVMLVSTTTSTVTYTITSTYQMLCTALPHEENRALLATETPKCAESPSLTGEHKIVVVS